MTNPKNPKPLKESWLDDLDLDNVKKVSEMNIIPQLKIADNSSEIVQVVSLPELTKYADDNEYYTMLVKQNSEIYQINCNAKSFRFQLASICVRDLNNDFSTLIDKTIKISKSEGTVDTDVYKGKAQMYRITLIQ